MHCCTSENCAQCKESEIADKLFCILKEYFGAFTEVKQFTFCCCYQSTFWVQMSNQPVETWSQRMEKGDGKI